ncbi:MAG: phosphoesterase PA-phosphatase-like protein [Bacteroidetes bacterium OLB9]|nr:MAG: phosphoesterase PA-phosphatase-like protein [Bacteroidetes bacterium OLB9]
MHHVQKKIDDDQPTNTQSKLVADYPSDVIHDWNEVFLRIERYAEGYRPGPAPTALAYIGLACYESVISGMPDYKSLDGNWQGFNVPKADPAKEYCWPLAINAAYEFMIRKYFEKEASEEHVNLITTTARFFNNQYKDQVSTEVYDRSINRGREVAEAVWAFAVSDKVAYNHYLDPFQGYDWRKAFKKEGDWIATFPGPGEGAGGVWGNARVFSITPEQKLCIKPIPYSNEKTSQLYAQALEVYSKNTPTLSYEDEWIAEFWSDDLTDLTFSPGVRYLAIGDQILKNDKRALDIAVLMNAYLGIAISDAGVAAWYSKYYYNVERPETYIQREIDPTWKPSLDNPLTGETGITPSFPAFPSGHATFHSASAEVFGYLFGYNYSFTDLCHKDRTEFSGAPRTFSSFNEAMNECAWSRLLLGVHYRMDGEASIKLGTEIGRAVERLPWKK